MIEVCNACYDSTWWYIGWYQKVHIVVSTGGWFWYSDDALVVVVVVGKKSICRPHKSGGPSQGSLRGSAKCSYPSKLKAYIQPSRTGW